MGLLDIKPHQVSRNLRGYSVFFYGAPKSGKTTIASKFPGSLILAFEKGYSTIPGIMVQPVNSWGEFKKVLTELKDEAVKEKFQTIVIDTADIAYDYCEKYICGKASDMKNSYDSISEIPYGKGYSMCQQEFDESIRKILQLDYGLVLISHDIEKTFKDEQGNEYSQIIPTLDKRARLICERTCDIIGYARSVNDENEGTVTKLFLRGTPRFVAGSRFKYTPDSIVFTYDNLVNAIADAIDAEAKAGGADSVTDNSLNMHTMEAPKRDFNSMMEEFQQIVGDLMSKNPDCAGKITAVVDQHLGKGKKVGDCNEDQAEQIDLILYDLKRL